MKRLTLFIIVILQGCSLSKNAPLALNGSYYICDKGEMVGNTTILFRDSTFIYTERDGLLESEGKWKLSSNGKFLLLEGVKKNKSGDINLSQKMNLELRIKRMEKLIGDGCVFLLKK
jgi:hypothetical protein